MLLAALVLGAVSWSAPPSCPPEREFQERLAGVQSRVDARVRELAVGVELELSIDDQQRTLVSPSCAEAFDSAVFLVELSGQWASKREPLAIAQSPAEPAPPPTVEVAPVVPVPRRFHLAAIGGAEWELLPQPVARFGLSAQLDVSWVRVTLDVRTSPSLRIIRSGLEMAGVLLTPFIDAQLGACHLFEVGRVGVGPCVLGGFGLVEARGVNVEDARTKLVPVWKVGAGARAAIAITEAFEVQAFLSLRFGAPPRFVHGETATVLVATNIAGIDGGLGIGARF